MKKAKERQSTKSETTRGTTVRLNQQENMEKHENAEQPRREAKKAGRPKKET